MADLSRLKKRNTLGEPPTIEEASQNLSSPEVAPVVTPPLDDKPGAPGTARIDGRSLRRTNRTVQFATKVTPEYDEKFRSIAAQDGLDFCVLLEKMLSAYEKKSI